MNPLLQAHSLTKRFPGVTALDAVDFAAHAGEIHALMGENGAGKSTLIKVLTGVYPRDGGDITLAGASINPTTPLAAQKLGIATVYQEVNLVPQLSVAENIFLGRFPKTLGFIRRRQISAGAREALARLDLKIDVTKPVADYPVALQQMVAIARSLSMEARVLILDEPTSSLDRNEVEQLFTAMRKLKAQGIAIIFVSHFLDQIYAVSDRITVLRNGKYVGERLAASLPRPELISMMVGRPVGEVEAMNRATPPAEGIGDTFLSATALTRKGSVEGVDLSIRRGEAVGLAGLLGSGRTETARLLFAADKLQAGSIAISATPAIPGKHPKPGSGAPASPRAAIAAGLAFLPEDRKIAGIFPDLSVRENIVIALQASRGWWRPLSAKKQRDIADHYIRALRIKTSSAEKSIKLLSGGNQQKAIISRWLANSPQLFILDEPTRGIDIGAKAEIAALMESLRKKGMALLVITSELEELPRMCQRVIVLRDRRKIGELSGSDVSEHNILAQIAN